MLDFHLSDSYFVVAHFHYVIFGTVVFAMFSGFYFWWPKWTGKMLNERLGKIHFWILFIGFHMTFLVQHGAGVMAMPRLYYPDLPEDGVTGMNQLSTAGAMILGISMIPFPVSYTHLDVYKRQRHSFPGIRPQSGRVLLRQG